jgi:hypothetical protein
VIQAVLLVCLPLSVALVGHSVYRVRQANREHAAKLAGDPEPTSTVQEW